MASFNHKLQNNIAPDIAINNNISDDTIKLIDGINKAMALGLLLSAVIFWGVELQTYLFDLIVTMGEKLTDEIL